ncbi:class I adenylate cyclase [Stutzerimonas stutzeri]|uniref:class I adenylate cyclase n=1 Tax=Stutzerimonas stutzeri TaxID=316 RepID=UPI00265A50F4|nr:class I adenylate cyclase [Stutzerimonas stutzeri]MCF6781289.1 class I adenylate cyclase [Stutzerimonas stutzeri]MCF6805185.1 class I adenylate cyclase [Stutzerimonas stutzeri]
MTRFPEIHPVLEDGIDRKVLATLRARFLTINRGRLERALETIPARQQPVLKLLPLLFHVNHPIMPGYVSGTVPAGLDEFEPDAETLAEAQRLSRSFSHKPQRGKLPQPIQSLFLMGSPGTIAQEEQSDLDVWVCHDPQLPQQQLDALRTKCEALKSWAASLGCETHFFLINPERFIRGQRESKLTSEDCGTTQHYLLLDEFYRTAIWLGGRTPLWWLVPDYEEHRYDDYVSILLSKRFVRSEEVLDLGNLGNIPAGEYLGAGLWQLYKALEAPYKSLLKLLLIEVYASEHPQLRCLSLDYKRAVYRGQMELDELDPYIAAYHRIESYLLQRGDQERLELLRRCLYLKTNKPLSRPPTRQRKSWQRCLLERLSRDWGWDERQFIQLDRRGQWKTRQVEQERRALVNELTYAYRFLGDFARRQNITSSIDARDLGILGRRLQASIERKAGKIEAINLGISPDMAEDQLTLVQSHDAAGNLSWALYEGSLHARELANFSPLKRTRELIPLLGWCHLNGIIGSATHVSLHPGDSGMTEAELFALLTGLRQTIPMPPPPVSEETLLSAAVPIQVLMLINAGFDPFKAEHTPASKSAKLPGYDTPRENLVLSIDLLTLNSWNELIVSHHTGPLALANCLSSYLASLTEGRSPALQIRCFTPQTGTSIARRVEEIIRDSRQALAETADSRYLLQIRQQFHLFDLQSKQLQHTQLNDLAALNEYLGEAHHRPRPLHLDRNLLAGHDLPLILAQSRAGCLQIFYRIEGDQAELSVLDEFNALWRQRLPYRDEQSLLTPLRRFLHSLEHRRRAQDTLDATASASMEILFYRIMPALGDRPTWLERRNPPRIEVNDPLHDVQAIVEPGEQKRSQVTLYCNQQEFSSLEYGNGLFAAVARYILAQRRLGERYPCYITDLDLSALHGSGRPQTVQYLRYKTHLEAALNQAMMAREV